MARILHLPPSRGVYVMGMVSSLAVANPFSCSNPDPILLSTSYCITPRSIHRAIHTNLGIHANDIPFLPRNMFLAAFPYFTHRFSTSPTLLHTFPSAIISISTLTNLLTMLLLTSLQPSTLKYPFRITLSLILNTAVFTLLALSTVLFTGISPGIYFGFLMAMVLGASLATGLCQNGVFAYVSGFGEGRYTQGIMTGQGVAGVLPCVAQIVSVLSVGEGKEVGMGRLLMRKSTNSGLSIMGERREEAPQVNPQESPKSAFAYFLTAAGIAILTLLAFSVLLKRHRHVQHDDHQHHHHPTQDPTHSSTSPSRQTITPQSPKLNSSYSPPEAEPLTKSTDPCPTPPVQARISYTTLFHLLPYPSIAIILTFALTLAIFPTSTQAILSTHPVPLPRLLRPETFIPLAFLCWNTGDLLGRLATAFRPLDDLARRPRLLLGLAVGRVVFIPLYYLCNRSGDGKGAVFGDFFYLLFVQGGFGFSNGVLGSSCMMTAGLVGDDDDGGKMGLGGGDDDEGGGEGEGGGRRRRRGRGQEGGRGNLKEAAGGWMSLMLVVGLTVGSLLSFAF